MGFEDSINFMVEKLKEFSHNIKPQNGEVGCSEDAINFVSEKLKVFCHMIKLRGENMDFEESIKYVEEKILSEAWVQVLGPFLPYAYKAIRRKTNEDDLLNNLIQLLPISLRVAFEDKMHQFQIWFNQVFPPGQKRTQHLRLWLKVVLVMVAVLVVLILVYKLRWSLGSVMKAAAVKMMKAHGSTFLMLLMTVFEDDPKASFLNRCNALPFP